MGPACGKQQVSVGRGHRPCQLVLVLLLRCPNTGWVFSNRGANEIPGQRVMSPKLGTRCKSRLALASETGTDDKGHQAQIPARLLQLSLHYQGCDLFPQCRVSGRTG